MNTKMTTTMVVKAMTKVTRIMAIMMMKTMALKGMVISDFDYDFSWWGQEGYTLPSPLKQFILCLMNNDVLDNHSNSHIGPT